MMEENEFRLDRGPRRVEIVRLLAKNGAMRSREIAAALGTSEKNIGTILKPMIEAGIVEKIGGFRGHWRLVEGQQEAPTITEIATLEPILAPGQAYRITAAKEGGYIVEVLS